MKLQLNGRNIYQKTSIKSFVDAVETEVTKHPAQNNDTVENVDLQAFSFDNKCLACKWKPTDSLEILAE